MTTVAHERPSYVAVAVDRTTVEPVRTVDVSLVVPTRNEADVISEFVRRAVAAMSASADSGVRYEILVVDDSDDDTPDVVERMRRDGHPVRCVHRARGDRAGGLGGALTRGFAAAGGDIVVVMDADLQHPPEVVPDLVSPLAGGRADLVVASRHVPGGSGDGLDGWHRVLASAVARAAVHMALPSTRCTSDPCGGFFAFRRSLVDGVDLRPDGFKILVEILARTRWERVVEVPYTFAARGAGTSKFDRREVARFARHIGRLALVPGQNRLVDNDVASLLGGPGVLVPVESVPAVDVSRALDGALSALTGGGEPRPGLRARFSARAAGVPFARWATWWVLATFLVTQVTVTLFATNGPFLDEGIYITAGERTLQGHGVADGYLGWFAGSLLWPALTGIAYHLGGLEGSRILAALLVTIGFALAARATRNLFGDAAAAWGVAAICASAASLQLGHLAVYDVASVAGLGLTLAGVTDLYRTGHRGYVVVAAAGFALAALAKYPVAVFLPFFLVLLLVLRRRAAIVDILQFLAVLSAVALMFFLPFRAQLVFFVQWRLTNNPSFGVTRAMVEYEQVRFVAPFLVLVVVGLVVVRRELRLPALVLAAALPLFPAYHVLTANAVSASKHVVFGMLIALPVAGAGLARVAGSSWWRRAVVLVVVVAGVAWGLQGMARMDRGWNNAELGGGYLAENMRPGDTLLVPNAWQVLPYLYGHGVDDLTTVVDAYGFQNAAPPIDVCTRNWVVNTTNDNAWSDAFLAEMDRCGTFVEVFRSSSTLTNLGQDLKYVTYDSDFVVYKNTDPRT